MKTVVQLFILFALLACNKSKNEVVLIDEQSFITDIENEEIKLFTLKNSAGMVSQITNLGGRVVNLWVPDRNGQFADVCIGYNTAKEYLENDESYFGAIIGRYGNRIGNAEFVIDSIAYNLIQNDGANSLHGGSAGFHKRIWKVNSFTQNKLELSYVSEDGEEGFPGNLDVKVIYELTDKNELKIEYFASTDKPSHVNLTNHTYFNLKGEAQGTINDHYLMINADKYTPVDDGLIPTGEIALVKGTPLDFRKPEQIGSRIDVSDDQLQKGGGYDHNWVLNKDVEGSVSLAASLKESVSGRVMEVYTNEPGIQFYSGNFLNGKYIGKYGKSLKYREALCLETQHFPDSPNKPDFPTTLLNPGEKYYSVCIYSFKTE